MIAYGKKQLAAVRRRALEVRGDVFHKSEWMDSGQTPGLAPTVFLAEQPPNCALEPHFHTRNQFQLFVHGTGRIGPQEIRPVTIHYAGAFTGYGPLLSGSEGLKYFTIRSQYETGFIPATQAREKMIRGPKRHEEAFVGEPSGAHALAALVEVEQRYAVEPEDGLCVRLIRMPPSAQCMVAPVPQSTGCFLFVLSGIARVAGVDLEPWESAFVPSTDGVQEVESADVGAEVVALHIPDEAPEYAGRAVAPGGGDHRRNASELG